MTVSMSYEKMDVMDVEQLHYADVELSAVSYDAVLDRQEYRVSVGDDGGIGVWSISQDGTVCTQSYGTEYALISTNLNTVDELSAHLMYEHNEIITMSADDDSLKLRLRTDDAGDDIEVIITTDPEVAYYHQDDVVSAPESLSDDLDEYRREDEESLDQMYKAFEGRY